MIAVDTSQFQAYLVSNIHLWGVQLLKELGDFAKEEYLKLVKFFREHRAWVEIEQKDGEIIIELRSDVPEDAINELAVLLSRGTNVRKVALSKSFRRSTTPNSLAVRPGSGGELRSNGRPVYGNFKGISARNWHILVTIKTEKEIQNMANKTFKQVFT